MVREKVYLDYAASTPLDERVLAAMASTFRETFGNPSSVHRFGQAAEAALEDSRERMAQGLGCLPREVIFTSGGTESDNLAVRGAALAARRLRRANHVLTTPVEHPAVIQAGRFLRDEHGFEIETLPVDSAGRVDPEAVRRALRPETAIVSVIYANNEIGTLNPIREIAAVCRSRGVPFHTDAVQAAAHLPIAVDELQVDLLSLGAHKFYGPKGVGALYCRSGVDLAPIQPGGGQEAGRRAGTENVPLIVGLATAFELAGSDRDDVERASQSLRERIIDSVTSIIPAVALTGHRTERLPNHASFAFEGVDGNRLLAALDLAGFACSSGSACKTGDPEPSSVLLAIGLSPPLAMGSLRVTVGRPTTEDEISRFLEALPDVISALRQRSAVVT